MVCVIFPLSEGMCVWVTVSIHAPCVPMCVHVHKRAQLHLYMHLNVFSVYIRSESVQQGHLT